MPPNPEPQTQPHDVYDALDEALMETFPASDPVAVSEPLQRPEFAHGALGLESEMDATILDAGRRG